ncbi:GNAT family N-acetyltransferase [Acidicapsa dinghuensis]|uniref:GNAT family N-acetyltransferase n=1 Tax=Acidicapsa dinghuensis TaxID=2218256 RepID=A0ABW1EC22_9BACT|nr:GNAT family protein [Acidicapsa dinghuensis]
MPEDLSQWRGAQPPASVTLEGRFVRLEPLSAEKHTAAIWRNVYAHDEVWDYLGDGPYAGEEDLYAAIHAKETGAAARFFAILPLIGPDAGEAVGYASLMRIDTLNGVIEVGNLLFSPRLQRTPAATEAMYRMTRYVFDDLGYRRYEWKCNALNLPSRRAADRLGFSFEGIFRQHMVVKGQNRDTAWFAMLDHEWPSRRAAFEAWLAPENFDHEGRQVRSLKEFRGES